MITLSPSQSMTISNCLVTSSLLKSAFGTSNAQLQTIDSFLTGTTAANSTAGNNTGSIATTSNSASDSTGSSAGTSGITASSLLGSLINTLA